MSALLTSLRDSRKKLGAAATNELQDVDYEVWTACKRDTGSSHKDDTTANASSNSGTPTSRTLRAESVPFFNTSYLWRAITSMGLSLND